METFREAYCRRFACASEHFDRQVFWQVVYPHARVLRWFGLYSSEFFATDRALITYCGILRSTRQVRDELRDFGRMGENRRFLRRVLLLRVSRRRLQRLVRECWADAHATDRGDGCSESPFENVTSEVAGRA